MADSSIEIQISARGADQVVKDFKAINAQVTALNKKIGDSAGINKFVKSMADASKNFTKALKSMEQALNKIKGSTQAVQNAQKQQSNARSQQIRNQIADLRALGTAERQANRLQARFDRAGFNSGSGPASALRGLRGDIAGLPSGGPERTLAMVAAQQKYNRAIDASQEKFRGLNGTVDTAVRRTGRLGTSFSGLRGILLNTGVALSSLTAILGLREILNAIRTIQRFQFTIQAASTDTLQFNKNMDFLSKAAQEIGINLAEVGQPFGRFILAAKQSGIEGEVANQSFAKIAASMRNLGGSAADTAGVVRAFEQSLSKGKFMAEEVRLQLGDRLPVAMTALQTATGMTGDELNKAFEAGELSTEKFFLPFVQALFDATGGSDQLAQSSRGLAAEQARLGTAGLEAAEAFGEGGFTKAMTDLNREFATFLQNPGTLDAISNIGVLVGGLVIIFGNLAKAIGMVTGSIATGYAEAKKASEESGFDILSQFMAFVQGYGEAAYGFAKGNQDKLLGTGGGQQNNPNTQSLLGPTTPMASRNVSTSPRPPARPTGDALAFIGRRNEAFGRLNNPTRTAYENSEALTGAAFEGKKAHDALEREILIREKVDQAIVKNNVSTMHGVEVMKQAVALTLANEDAIQIRLKAEADAAAAEKKSADQKARNRPLIEGLQDKIIQQKDDQKALNDATYDGAIAEKRVAGEIQIRNTIQAYENQLIRLGMDETSAANIVKGLEAQLTRELSIDLLALAAARDAEREAADARERAEAQRLAAEAARSRQKVTDVKLQIQNMDAENDAMRRGATALKKFNAALAEENLLRDIEKKLTDDNISAKEREFLLDEMRRVQSERKIAQRGPQTLTDGFLAAGDTLKDYFDPDNYDSPGAALENSLVGAFGTATDALETFIKGGKVSFQDLRDQIIIDISFAMAKAFAMKAMTAAFGFADGGIMTGSGPMPLRSYARGGVANSPQMALFGEGSTPEAYVPLPDGRTIPVTMKGGGGGMTVVQNFDFSNADGSTVANLRQAASVIQEQTKQAIYAEMQDGGNVAKISGRR